MLETCRELQINTLKRICASSWTVTKNHCMMHGQQNVKLYSVLFYIAPIIQRDLVDNMICEYCRSKHVLYQDVGRTKNAVSEEGPYGVKGLGGLDWVSKISRCR